MFLEQDGERVEVEIALARVVGTTVGEGAHLLGRIGDGGETTVLAVLRSPSP
ncbi:hypothetical protein [Nocardioides oleivorans]|uniref:hypothetical protein n=1 Tax=Nocardioides oleivorans TaxID=273676 RepID=UPI0013EACF8B|nr:hypothetical protein [Nocardioides oleivorans]